MLYRCSACQHQQPNPERMPLCPQCCHEWQPAAIESENAVQKRFDAPRTSVSVLGSKQGESIDLPASGFTPIRPIQFETPDFSKLVALSSGPLNASLMPGSMATGSMSTLSQMTGANSIPITVSVNKLPQDSQASRVCLEIRLVNRSENVITGHLWLSDTLSNDGTPVSFTLPANQGMNIGGGSAVMVHPILSGHSASEGHIAVRVRQTGTGDAFWQGELILHRQHNGQILVDIDKSVRSETHVGGLDNGVVNIYANQHIGSNWHEVQLRLRGPKDLADPKDVRPPTFSGKERNLRVRPDYSGVPLVETARLTLSHRLPDNRECYTQLLAGPYLNLGRARTWDSKNHRGLSPNEIVLRSHRDDESDDYLSRFHGRLKFTIAGIEYENLSGGGTLVGHRQLSQKGDTCPLSDNVLIRPGQAMASNKDRSLGLQARRTECQISAESYNLLAQEAHLKGGVNTDIRNDVVTLTRTDRLQDSERYIFFRQAVRVGANAICGWHLPTDSVQQIHATILWFDDSFWIEPYAVNCSVRVNGVAVSVNRVRRLLPNSELEIGALRFLVLPEWKQHIISCQCCPGHGYEEGCRCSPCVEEWQRRKQ